MDASSKRVCVFCGASWGNEPGYAEAARALADALTARGLGLVYGGAKRGLMGVLADRVLERGGEVIGVIPERMVQREIAHLELTQLLVVQTMHERKARMAEHAGAFIALPGGFGTLEELMEVVTWSQLGLHDKPCGLLNHAGYFDHFLAFIAHMQASGFVRAEHTATLRVSATPDGLLDLLLSAAGGPALVP